MNIMYRPPFEANSFLLQVTEGCSHNACSFCTMYREVPFRMETMETVEAQLRRAGEYAPYIDRVFLENGDPFVLPADRLLAVAELVHEYFPNTKTIAMYASINNIMTKTDAELKALREQGINELNIGVESGLDEALTYMNKGYTAQQAIHELQRLRDAGIDYGAIIIFGCAGPALRTENAEATAHLLNITRPYLIFTGTLHADPGCPLYDDISGGSFAECTFGEYLDEEEQLLSRLELDNCLYFGLHPSNVLRVQGMLGRDRERMLEDLQQVRSRLGSRLDRHPVRRGEGAIVF